jgi:hypothetical protein
MQLDLIAVRIAMNTTLEAPRKQEQQIVMESF